MSTQIVSFIDPVLLRGALRAAFWKLSPCVQWRNPVMFVVYLGSLLASGLCIEAVWFTPVGQVSSESALWIGATAGWLWLTVLFANLAEALAAATAGEVPVGALVIKDGVVHRRP